MTDISASQVASLRGRTGVSILECKKALEEAGGDEEKAIEILRSKGVSAAAKKADREQSEGYIFSASNDSTVAVVVVHCETDFVSRSDDFQAFGKQLADLALAEGEEGLKAQAEELVNAAIQKLGENISLGDVHVVEGANVGSYVHTNGKIGVIVTLEGGDAEKAKDAAMHAAAMNPLYVTPEEVSADDVEKEKVIWSEQLKEEGKPEEIIEKIMMGKEKKFREENALVSQDFVKDPSMTVSQYLDGATVGTYLRVALG